MALPHTVLLLSRLMLTVVKPKRCRMEPLTPSVAAGGSGRAVGRTALVCLWVSVCVGSAGAAQEASPAARLVSAQSTSRHTGVAGDILPDGWASDSASQVRPLELPRSGDRDFRLGVLIGFFPYFGRYQFETELTLPDKRDVELRGTERSFAFVLGGAVALTFPGALRRLTVGGGVGLGGPTIYSRAPLPDSVSLPFAPDLLLQTLREAHKDANGSVPHFPSALHLFPFIEHDLKAWTPEGLAVRLRGGYQVLVYEGPDRARIICEQQPSQF